MNENNEPNPYLVAEIKRLRELIRELDREIYVERCISTDTRIKIKQIAQVNDFEYAANMLGVAVAPNVTPEKQGEEPAGPSGPTGCSGPSDPSVGQTGDDFLIKNSKLTGKYTDQPWEPHCKYCYDLRARGILWSQRQVADVSTELERLLFTSVTELYNEDDHSLAKEHPANWQAKAAREICERLLKAAKADGGAEGCRLCHRE